MNITSFKKKIIGKEFSNDELESILNILNNSGLSPMVVKDKIILEKASRRFLFAEKIQFEKSFILF